VLGLRFFACDRCGVVHADPEEPVQCGRCGWGRLEELTGRLQADSYFVPDQ
jgi:ribosomal protein L37E